MEKKKIYINRVGEKDEFILTTRTAAMARFTCPHCPSTFTRKGTLKNHVKRVHGNHVSPSYVCFQCEKPFFHAADYLAHRRTAHPRSDDFVLVENALHNACVTYRMTFDERVCTTQIMYRVIREALAKLLRSLQAQYTTFRYGLTLVCEYIRQSENDETSWRGEDGGEEEEERPDGLIVAGFEGHNVLTVPHRTHRRSVFQVSNAEALIEKDVQRLDEIVDMFVARGSNWVLNQCLYLQAEVVECLALTGACSKLSIVRDYPGKTEHFWFTNHVDLANQCFYLAVAYHFIRETDPVRLAHFIQQHIIRLEVPMRLKDIGKFEALHAKTLSLSFTVLYREGEEERTDKHAPDIIPIYVSDIEENAAAGNNIVLFYETTMSREEAGVVEGHFSYVSDLNKLLARRYHSTWGNRWCYERAVFCPRCLAKFRTQSELHQHAILCRRDRTHGSRNPKRIIEPSWKYELEFRHFLRKSRTFVTGFFDFETLQSVEGVQSCRCSSRVKECPHHVLAMSKQKAFAYTLLFIDREHRILLEKTYVGEDAVRDFMNTLYNARSLLSECASVKRAIHMTREDERAFQAADVCYLCGLPFRIKSEDDSRQSRRKCRDHDHYTGAYLGAAHNDCNLHRTESDFIPIFAHNFTGFDSHLILKEVAAATSDDGGTPFRIDSALPNNTEKFKTFQIGPYRFLDTMAFLPSSLEALVDDLRSGGHKFPFLTHFYPDSEQRELLLRKGVYCYEYATSIMRLLCTRDIPAKREFYSRLKNSHIDEEDYQHARRVFRAFRCDNLLDYTKLYVRTDVILMAEAYLAFREEIYNRFELETNHYLSLPMLAQDIWLLTTGAKVEFIRDPSIRTWLANAIRGGVSFINLRHHDLTEEEEKGNVRDVLVLLDVSNLYGWAMCQPLPRGQYRFLPPEQAASFELGNNLLGIDYNEDDESSTGFILEVDLHYPEALHLDHNSFPLAPEKRTISFDMLSPYARACYEEFYGKRTFKSQKLITSFEVKKHYVVHGRTLHAYLRLGLRVGKIHRVMSFRQSPFMRPYIEMCSKLRAESVSKFKSNLFKLLSNSLYGRMIMSQDKRLDVKFITHRESALRWHSSPRFKTATVCSPQLEAVFMEKGYIIANESWAIGFSILELSKYLMSHLFYEEIRPAFNGAATVLFSDTDSFLLRVPSGNVDEALSSISHLMDFANYDPAHPFFNTDRKNVVGFLKNESPRRPIQRFAGVRAKCYSYETGDNEGKSPRITTTTTSKCKGIAKTFRSTIPFRAYRDAVLNMTQHRVEQFNLQSKAHSIYLMKQNRLAFTSFDDKRYLMCAIHSVPYGSCLIDEFEKTKECYFCKHPNKFV